MVTLVDLDTVEPCYTLRPLKKELEGKGLKVLGWETQEVAGWGEAGTVLHPAARWALYREGDVIIDVGYGAAGAGTLHLLEGAAAAGPLLPQLQVVAVVNTTRPLTAGVEDIVAHIHWLGRVDGLLNNTHLGAETTVELIQAGAGLVTSAARAVKIPVVATAAMVELAALMGPADDLGNPVRAIERYMPRAFW